MLGFLIGTACLIGLVKVLGFRGHGHWGRHGACEGACRNDGFDDDASPFEGPWACRGAGWWRGGFGRGALLRSLLWRLDTTPGQEKVIASAFGDVQQAAAAVHADLRAARPELGRALRQEHFDETLFGELSHRADEAAQTMRRAVVDAIAKIHAVLDEKQRSVLAEIVERGGPFGRWRGWGGPYRGGAVSL